MNSHGGSLQQLKQTVQAWAQQHTALSAIILFGSRAKGSARPDSDWDICCLVDGSGSESWYGTWFAHAESWKAEFCQATGLHSDAVQFVAPTSMQVTQGLFECSRMLYVRDIIKGA
ncbi:nucleotidyltransferase domain-containing protein [Lysobacter sp. A286]